MTAAGLESLFPYAQLAIMGLTEVLPSVPKILRRVRQVTRDIERANPDVIVTIDSPGFVFSVIRRLKSRNCPRVHYVAPTIWAWRAGRVKKFRKNFDHLLALLPFEPPLFETEGLDCTFVGHPIAEGAVAAGDGVAFRARHGIGTDEKLLCVLPGSRRGEVGRLGPIIKEAIERLSVHHPDLRIVIPAAPIVRAEIECTRNWGYPVLIVDGATERYDAFAAANVALAASGTVTLELAYAGVPSVVIYKVGDLTGEIVRRMIKVKFVSIVNLVGEKEIFPEFIQSRCRPKPISQAVSALLESSEGAQMVGKKAQRVARQIAGEGDMPSIRAAAVIQSIVDDARTS